ncbi:MAG: hypothetical protein KJ749_05720 [Planctomycetes bacterium]|nr:hypothetical protein [Planctomycetota bacterium]
MQSWCSVYAKYYLPLWMTVVLVLIQWGATAAAGGERPVMAADVFFGMFTFWIWALTINGCSGYLARTSGKLPGTPEERTGELAISICLLLLTLVAYLFCHNPEVRPHSWMIAGAGASLPVLFMERPK